jgi:hypothetical protein
MYIIDIGNIYSLGLIINKFNAIMAIGKARKVDIPNIFV